MSDGLVNESSVTDRDTSRGGCHGHNEATFDKITKAKESRKQKRQKKRDVKMGCLLEDIVESNRCIKKELTSSIIKTALKVIMVPETKNILESKILNLAL